MYKSKDLVLADILALHDEYGAELKAAKLHKTQSALEKMTAVQLRKLLARIRKWEKAKHGKGKAPKRKAGDEPKPRGVHMQNLHGFVPGLTPTQKGLVVELARKFERDQLKTREVSKFLDKGCPSVEKAKRKKRKLSGYNLYVKKVHAQGGSFADAARRWKDLSAAGKGKWNACAKKGETDPQKCK